jgi:hypothetical protein
MSIHYMFNMSCLFEWKRICVGFSLSLDYICIAVADPIIERRGLYPIKRLNSVTFVRLSKARTWISNGICPGLFYVEIPEVRGDCSFGLYR